jgi:hypothetical protein
MVGGVFSLDSLKATAEGYLEGLNYKHAVIGVRFLEFAFNYWVDYRELKAIQKKDQSKDLKKLDINEEQYKGNQEYAAESFKFRMFVGCYDFALNMAVVGLFDG